MHDLLELEGKKRIGSTNKNYEETKQSTAALVGTIVSEPLMQHFVQSLCRSSAFLTLVVSSGAKQSQTRQVGKYECPVHSLLTSCCMVSVLAVSL